MSEQLVDEHPSIDTLLELLDRYWVVVPMVQRDYAQGRQEPIAELVRANLLRDMRAALFQETAPLDLNFVYGKVEEGNRFIPLDGQQRLTTLFLLHVYAFQHDEAKTAILKKFSYETRKTSRDFLERLVEHRSTVFSSELHPSLEVEDSEWFVASWRHDPTIQSALVMLDCIAATFDNTQLLAAGLSSEGSVPITFKFLDMDNLGMADNLYIKLNARGRPLTPFENFKARLIGALKKLDIEFNGDFNTQFELLMDGEWTDLFWEDHKEDFDSTFLSFFGVLLRNLRLIASDNDWSNVFDYERATAEFFRTIQSTLNFLCAHPEEVEARGLIFSALTGTPSYGDRVLFHAVTTYLRESEGVDRSGLTPWLRVIKNLVLNTRIDEQRLYDRAIDGVNELISHSQDVLSYLAAEGRVTGFDSGQLREEWVKARLILQDEAFAAEIFEAETHPYFSGQIRSALQLAETSEGKVDRDRFKHHWSKISALFEKSRPKHGRLLRQALLSIDDYTLQVGDFKTLCVNDPSESERTPSLKQLFSEHSLKVQPLLDMLSVDEDIEHKLVSIVDAAELPALDWRRCFLDYPDLFGLMSTAHLRLREVDHEMLIIRNKSSNGYNFQLFLVALRAELTVRKVESKYHCEQGTRAEHFLNLDEEGGMHVRFEAGTFSIHQVTGDNSPYMIFESKSNDPVRETADWISARP